MKVGCLENKGLVIGGGSKKMFNIWYLSLTAPLPLVMIVPLPIKWSRKFPFYHWLFIIASFAITTWFSFVFSNFSPLWTAKNTALSSSNFPHPWRYCENKFGARKVLTPPILISLIKFQIYKNTNTCMKFYFFCDRFFNYVQVP